MGILVKKMTILAIEMQEVAPCNFATLSSFLLRPSVLPLGGLVFQLGDFCNRAFLSLFGLGLVLVVALGSGLREGIKVMLVLGLG